MKPRSLLSHRALVLGGFVAAWWVDVFDANQLQSVVRCWRLMLSFAR